MYAMYVVGFMIRQLVILMAVLPREQRLKISLMIGYVRNAEFQKTISRPPNNQIISKNTTGDTPLQDNGIAGYHFYNSTKIS